MKLRTRINFAIFIGLFLISNVSMAALIEQDLYTSGDGLITFDESTELEWLDISQTVGWSYNQLVTEFGVGGAFEGWRYAMPDEWRHLIGEAGLVEYVAHYTTPNTVEDVIALATLLDAPGIETFVPGIGSFQSYITLGMTWSEFHGISGTPYDDYLVEGLLAVVGDDPPLPYVGDWSAWANPDLETDGNYLVRRAASVPEPATFFLMGLGLLVMMFNHRNFRWS